jgi:hypothetical protein
MKSEFTIFIDEVREAVLRAEEFQLVSTPKTAPSF